MTDADRKKFKDLARLVKYRIRTNVDKEAEKAKQQARIKTFRENERQH